MVDQLKGLGRAADDAGFEEKRNGRLNGVAALAAQNDEEWPPDLGEVEDPGGGWGSGDLTQDRNIQKSRLW